MKNRLCWRRVEKEGPLIFDELYLFLIVMIRHQRLHYVGKHQEH